MQLTARMLPSGMSSYAAAGTPGGGIAGAAAAATATAGGGGPDTTNVSTSLPVIRSSGPVPFTIYTHITSVIEIKPCLTAA